LRLGRQACHSFDELALADWRSASKRLGLTYDFIHVNTSGARIMLRVLKVAMGI
jgi:hypothetical protein